MSVTSSIKRFLHTRDELSLNNIRKELWAVIIIFPLIIILGNMRHIDLNIEIAGFQAYELILYPWGLGWLVLALSPKRFIISLLKISVVLSAVFLMLQMLFTADISSRLPGAQLSVFMAFILFNGICSASAFYLFCYKLNNVERLLGLIIMIIYFGFDFSIFKMIPSVQGIYETWGGIIVMAFCLVTVFLLGKKSEDIIIDDNKPQISNNTKGVKFGIVIPLQFVYFSTMILIHYLEPAQNLVFSLPYGLGQFISIIFIFFVMILLNRNALYIWLMYLVFTLFGLAIVNYNTAATQFSGSLIFGTGDGLGYIITIYLCAGAIKKSKSIKLYKIYCLMLFIEYVFVLTIFSLVFSYFAEYTYTIAFVIVLVLCSLCFLLIPYLQKKLFSEDWTDGLSVADIPEYAPALEQAQKADREDNLGLTPREKDVFALLMQNMPLKTIALELGITFNTVNSHYRSIYRKLGITSKGELFMKYQIKT